MSDQPENPLACRADHGERVLMGALLGCSPRSDFILASFGEGECLSSQRLKLIYTACRTIRAEGRQSDCASVADWLEGRGRLGEAGGESFLASLMDGFVTDALVEQHCAEVHRAHRGRQTQDALLVAGQRLAAGDNPDRVAAELSDRLLKLAAASQECLANTLSISDLLSEEVPSMKWIVDGIVPSNGFCMIAGESGVGKTWLLLDLALSVAAGRPWLGAITITQGPVLYLDEESGPTLLKERLLKLAEPEELTSLAIHLSVFKGIKIDAPQGFAGLKAMLKTTGAKLLIIDSFVRIHGGDENAVADMSKVTEALSKTAREFDCAIVVAHHARKQSQVSNDPGQMLRGTSELKAALDVHLFVTKGKNGVIRIQHEKARFGKTVEPLLMKLGEDEGGKIRLTCAKESVAKLEEARKAIEEHLKDADADEWVLRRDLESAVCKEEGVSKRTFAQALKQMREEGKLEEDTQSERTERGGTRTLKVYRWKREVSQ